MATQPTQSIYDDPRMVEQRARGERATLAIRRCRDSRRADAPVKPEVAELVELAPRPE